MIWDDRFRGCNWRKLRAAALQESHAHRAYARQNMPTPKTAPLTLWYDAQLTFDELLPDAGAQNGKNMTIKLPWTQLAEFCGQQYDPTNEITNISDIGIVSRLTGINRHTLYNYIRHGLSVWQADDIAVALGVHPSAIWPRWYEITGNLDQEAK